MNLYEPIGAYVNLYEPVVVRGISYHSIEASINLDEPFRASVNFYSTSKNLKQG